MGAFTNNGPVTAQSFTAGSADIAGTVVAFETGSGDVPVTAGFGVSVVGSTCGVYGQGTNDAQQDRRKAPLGTGVFGRGDTYGVYGVENSVPEFEVPDFSALSGGGPIAVVGINSNEFSPAVLGDNNILKSDIDTRPELKSAINEGAQLAVGVEGISRHGHGVFGISLNLFGASFPVDPEVGGVRDTAKGRIPDPTTGEPVDIKPAGVLGLSVEGAGVCDGPGCLDSFRGGIS